MVAFAEELKWDTYYLMGHSRGAGIAAMIAGFY